MNVLQVKRAGEVIEPEDGDQHQNRAEHGVQNELHRGVNPAIVTPHADDEVHGDEHHFPENEEEKKIERNEDADQARFENQQGGEEALEQSWMDSQEQRIARGVRNVVKSTRKRLMPSTPRW